MALEITQILQLIHRTACGTQAFALDTANTLKQSQMKKLSNAPEMGDKFLKKFSRRCDCILYTILFLYKKTLLGRNQRVTLIQEWDPKL